MASRYGLSCANPSRDHEDIWAAEGDNARLDARYLGQTVTTSLPRIAVCARPKGITVNEWRGGPGINGTSTTTNEAEYAKQIAKATVIYYLDPKAPPESVWNFGKDTKTRCPGKPPMPYDQWVAANTSGVSQQSGSKNASTSSTADASGPKTGDGKTTSTSSPDGQGPPLDPFEALAQELVIAGKLATADTSAPLTVADGSRHGMPGGKKVGGFSFPALQAGVGLVSIAIGVGMKPQDFIKKVVEKTGIGKPAIVKELNADALRLADELIAECGGQYVMAESIRKQKLILPYAMAKKFTAGLESKFQAHKIFEGRAFKDVLKMEGKTLKEAIDKAPAIILTDEQHKIISKALNDAWTKKPPKDLAALREIYKDVYQTDPHWLEAIESYFH